MGVTMLTLARFTLKGPYQAALVVGLLAVLAVFIPPVISNSVFGVLLASLCMMLSCTLVGLIILAVAIPQDRIKMLRQRDGVTISKALMPNFASEAAAIVLRSSERDLAQQWHWRL